MTRWLRPTAAALLVCGLALACQQLVSRATVLLDCRGGVLYADGEEHFRLYLCGGGILLAVPVASRPRELGT